MTNITEPIVVVKNLYAWIVQVRDAIRNDRDASIFDVYTALTNNIAELGAYIKEYDEAHKDDPTIVDMTEGDESEDE